MTEGKTLYRVEWTGTAKVWGQEWHGDECRTVDFSHRVTISGWLTVELEGDDAARELYSDDSDRLLDVDFMYPGKKYSASNGDVVEGEANLPPDHPEWEFETAVVLRVDRVIYAAVGHTLVTAEEVAA